TMIRPNSYLEIGVRRGRSAAVVAASCPQCAIYGFDLWIPGYHNEPNPGPDFVRSELRAVGHEGPVELVAGDSRETVPAFLQQQPDLYFDVITVDGDHSVMGAAADLANTLPRLKVGGVLVFDDVAAEPPLQRVWERVVERDSRYASWTYTDSGAGVAVAIRISDGPARVPLYWANDP
ncbi:MAG: class I SAM-dependent methyltransferase, partial [Dehalococcoidia bacterium]|nr:class I SAM-dependent methyltransferase [Dehalococcoidia bacterium]